MRGTEFAELSAFVAVAERSNFAKAAKALGIAPSTLSHGMRALEERLGVRLFNRTTRSVALTTAGERLLARVQPAFAELGSAVESINDFRDSVSGSLRLSVSTLAGQMILAPMLKAFLDEYPAITLEIAIDDSNSDIVSGRFDAGVRYGKRIERDMVTLRVGPESRLIALAAPAYLAHHPPPETPDDLARHNCIRLRGWGEQILPWAFESDGAPIEVGVNGNLIVNHPDMLLAAVRDGIGIGTMLEAYALPDLRAGRLVPVLADWSTQIYSYHLYYTSRRHIVTPLRLFIDFLRRQPY